MSVIDYQICLAQPTAGAEEWFSIKDLGGSDLVRETSTCGMDSVSFQINGQSPFTDDALFSYHATVRLRKVVDDVTSYWFIGRVASIPRRCSGRAESQSIRIEGPWSWFEACTFRQPWAASGGGITKPRAILFCASDGSRITTGAQIIEAINFAIAAGAPIATATSDTVANGFTPPFDEQVNVKVSDVISKALSYHPHAVVWFDYTQRAPVFHCAARTDLSSVSRSIAGREDISISQRTDLQAPAVAICYDQSGSVDGEPAVVSTLDWAPVIQGESTAVRDARLAAADVVWACYDLQGSSVTTVSQLITVEAFPSNLNTVAWWKARVPWLSEFADSDLALSGGSRLYDSNLSNIKLTGEKQPWMNSVSIEQERVRVNVAFIRRATVDGVSTIVERGTTSVTLQLWVTGASVGSNLYRYPVSVDEGEPVPTGVAAQMYAEWSQLHHQGTVTFVDDDPPGDLTPGHSLNLTSGRSEWSSMAAMVIRCTESVDSGRTTVEFGTPNWIDIDSRVAFMRATRTRNVAASRIWLSGMSANGVTGPVSDSVIRDGNVPSAFVRQLFVATGSVSHKILIDPNSVTKSSEETTESVLQPREMLLPYQDNGSVKAKLAQVLCSEAYGDPVDIGSLDLADSAPQAVADASAIGTGTKAAKSDHVHADKVPSTPSSFADFSFTTEAGGSYGSSTWSAGSTGLKLTVVVRSYYNDGATTPLLLAYYRNLYFDRFGRLAYVTTEGYYTVDAPVAVTIS